METDMSLLNRSEAKVADAHFIGLSGCSKPTLESRSKTALNRLRQHTQEDPERILAFDPSGLDRETRRLYDRLSIIAMKTIG